MAIHVIALSGCTLIIPPHVEPFSFKLACLAYPAQEARFTPLRADQQERYKGAFIKIMVQSNTDLIEVAEQHELNLWQDVRFCGNELLSLWTTGELRYGDGEVNYASAVSAERDHVHALLRQIPQDAPKSYYFYLDAAGYLRDKDYAWHAPYNLKAASEDICVTMRGGSLISRGFVSNVIVIPKEKIRAAFQAPCEK